MALPPGVMRAVSRLSTLLLSAVLLLLASAAVAQPEETIPPLSPDQQAALYGIPVVTTVASALLALRLGERLDPYGWVPFAMLPFLSGAAVCGAGALTAIPGSCYDAISWGVRGALPGYAAIGLGFFVGADIWRDEAGVLLVVLGAIAAVVVPPFAAAAGYRNRSFQATPAVLRNPTTGATTLGLRFRVGL